MASIASNNIIHGANTKGYKLHWLVLAALVLLVLAMLTVPFGFLNPQ